MSDNDSLSMKQRRAVIALLSTATIEGAAAKAGVSPRSVLRWMEDPVFQSAIREAEGQAIDAATRKLIALQDGAILTITSIMADRNTAAGVRVRAARTILEMLLKLRELRNLEDRLRLIENMVYDNNQH